MSIADHVAIFLMGALDQPRAGKAKPDRADYWGQFAFPPSAFEDLKAACLAASPSGSLSGLYVPPKLHANLPADKKFPGIPDDWFIVRIATGPEFPPELFMTNGQQVSALPINGQQIRSEFYSGQRVRVNTYAFHYAPKNGGSAGIGFNLSGLMAVGGGDRLAIGNAGESSESAFAKYRGDAPAQQTQQTANPSAPEPNTAASSANGNPFQQTPAANAANPFA